MIQSGNSVCRRKDIEAAKLRLAFVFYGAANRRDWRTVSAGDVRLDPDEVRREVAPMLRSRESLLQGGIALDEKEMEFLTRLNDRGVIAPELLTPDEAMQATIREQPTLLWKALNVGRRGRPPAEEEVV